MECKTVSHINEDGIKTYKDKKCFDTLKSAIVECKVLNSKPKQLTKLVSYKCSNCHKYHIGRNGNKLTKKYKEQLIKKLDESHPNSKKEVINKDIYGVGNAVDTRFKGGMFNVVGKIDLSKIPKK